jgi:hypothetical protein
MKARDYDLKTTTKNAVKYRLIERAIKAHNRRMKHDCDRGEIPAQLVVADAMVWRGRSIVLFDRKGQYITEYRWYPKHDRLRRIGQDE